MGVSVPAGTPFAFLGFRLLKQTQRVQVLHDNGFWGVKRGLSTALEGTGPLI